LGWGDTFSTANGASVLTFPLNGLLSTCQIVCELSEDLWPHFQTCVFHQLFKSITHGYVLSVLDFAAIAGFDHAQVTLVFLLCVVFSGGLSWGERGGATQRAAGAILTAQSAVYRAIGDTH